MKNIYFSAFAAFVMLLSSCVGKGTTPEGPTPEEEVRSYGKDFVAKLTAKQLDSLKASYPDIVTADSIATLKSDTILVSETAPEQYDITLAEGVVLKATRSQDGNIKVISSRGLFAFPSDKMEMARKTGMWNDSLSDKELAGRLGDEEFFKYVKKTNKAKLGKMLVIGKGPSDGGGSQSVTNKSDKTIDGADYKVVKRFTVHGNCFSPGGVSYSTLKGKTLKPGQSMGYHVEVALMGWEEITNIKWQLPDDQLIAKYITFKGDEYQNYLKTKGQK